MQRPDTPYWVFIADRRDGGRRRRQLRLVDGEHQLLLPARQKGAALGLNAAGGNVGVAVIQFFLPIIVGGAGAFGLVKASQSGIVLERAGYLYAALAVVAAVARTSS